jgi:UMF1 family MFS transporter
LPRGALAWALYDLGNTIYSLNVVSLFFVQWVTVDRGREDLWFSLSYSGSMLLVALSLPYLGLWSDRSGRRLTFLGVFTAVCVVATAALAWATRVPGSVGLVYALMLFAVSNYGFQGGLVFYNSLLPQVSSERMRGRVSGLGVALGYAGSFLGLLLVVPFVEGEVPLLGWRPPFLEPGGRSAAFVPSALLFALFAVPLFARVREPSRRRLPRPGWKEAWRDLLGMLRDSARHPGLGRFLIANFLLLEGIHTAIIFISVFAEKVVGLPDTAKATFFMLATGPAVLGSLGAGWAVDRFGPRRVFTITAWSWVVCPILIALAPWRPVLYGTGAIIGILLGSLWTTTRPFLLSLIPPGREGRAFGLYAMSNRAAAVLGPQIWGITVLLGSSLGPDRYRLAIVVLALVAATGAFLLRGIPPDPGPAPDVASSES